MPINDPFQNCPTTSGSVGGVQRNTNPCHHFSCKRPLLILSFCSVPFAQSGYFRTELRRSTTNLQFDPSNLFRTLCSKAGKRRTRKKRKERLSRWDARNILRLQQMEKMCSGHLCCWHCFPAQRFPFLQRTDCKQPFLTALTSFLLPLSIYQRFV